jgi:hypothetical protein
MIQLECAQPFSSARYSPLDLRRCRVDIFVVPVFLGTRGCSARLHIELALGRGFSTSPRGVRVGCRTAFQ